MVNIKPRLSTAASLISATAKNKPVIAADIGSDHGYLPFYLIKSGIAAKVYASDISIHSIEKIKRGMNAYNISENEIVTACSDGLEFLNKDKTAADSLTHICIMGMGGNNAADILSGVKFDLHGKTLILQTNTKTEFLRKYLISGGYNILSETISEDADRLYITVTAEFLGDFSYVHPYSDAELLCGRELVPNKENDPALVFLYISRAIKRLEMILIDLGTRYDVETEFGTYYNVVELLNILKNP